MPWLNEYLHSILLIPKKSNAPLGTKNKETIENTRCYVTEHKMGTLALANIPLLATATRRIHKQKRWQSEYLGMVQLNRITWQDKSIVSKCKILGATTIPQVFPVPRQTSSILLFFQFTKYLAIQFCYDRDSYLTMKTTAAKLSNNTTS